MLIWTMNQKYRAWNRVIYFN